jgi:proteic killer suppression protein
VIKTFADKATAALFAGYRVKPFAPSVQPIARRKLLQIDAATALEDLRTPPGNRLEKLSGNRAGQWSIRINDQWRICFRWAQGDAFEVEITDYH